MGRGAGQDVLRDYVGWVTMADTIVLEIKDFEPPKFKCATCDNNITELRAMQLPICDDCQKVLREIIKERKENK